MTATGLEPTWIFVYELNGCGFKSNCSHLNFRFRAYFEQGVSLHSGNYRVWIHSETCTWHDKNMQSAIYSKNRAKLVETWDFTKNKLYYSLKLKMEITGSVTVSFTTIYCNGLKLAKSRLSHSLKLTTDSATGSVTGSSTACFTKSLKFY